MARSAHIVQLTLRGRQKDNPLRPGRISTNLGVAGIGAANGLYADYLSPQRPGN